jgi:hypothetical protein
LRIVTETPGMTPPCASLTVPCSVAVDWDHAGAAVQRTVAKIANKPIRAREAGRIDHPPVRTRLPRNPKNGR